MGKPSTPDAMQTANAQNQSNLFTAIGQSYLNQPNQNTPWGSIRSNVTGYNTVKGPNGEEYQIPQFTQTTTLDPYQQNIYETRGGIDHFNLNTASQRAGVLRDTLNQQINQPQYTQYGAGPNLNTTIADAGNIQRQIGDAGNILNGFDRGGIVQTQLGDQDSWSRVQDVENALFSRYSPQLEQDRQRLETQLANQGVRVGSTAWNTAMDQQARNVNDARLGITINAGQEQNRLQNLAMNAGNFANNAQAQQFGQNQALANFTNSAQSQRYGQLANNAAFTNQAQQQQYAQNANNAAFGNQAMQQGWQNQFATTQANNQLQDSRFANQIAGRNQLVNEQSALMNGAQVQMPQFSNMPQTQLAGTDVGSLINNQYNQQLSQYNNMWGGIGQLGAAVAPWLLSDKRAKTDIKKIGMMGKGVPLVEYRYKGTDQPQVGVLAQDAEKAVPSAVRTRPDGFKEVNYPRLRMALGV